MKRRGRPPKPLAGRFWAKVEKAGPDECWLWTASRTRDGYGQIARDVEQGRPLSAHRVAYALAHGLDPLTMEVVVVRHRCHNPQCVNPAHLEPGTHEDNARDRVRHRGR